MVSRWRNLPLQSPDPLLTTSNPPSPHSCGKLPCAFIVSIGRLSNTISKAAMERECHEPHPPPDPPQLCSASRCCNPQSYSCLRSRHLHRRSKLHDIPRPRTHRHSGLHP